MGMEVLCVVEVAGFAAKFEQGAVMVRRKV